MHLTYFCRIYVILKQMDSLCWYSIPAAVLVSHVTFLDPWGVCVCVCVFVCVCVWEEETKGASVNNKCSRSHTLQPRVQCEVHSEGLNRESCCPLQCILVK